jgi:hypothetical protein
LWAAHSGYGADGSISSAAAARGAFLPFTPAVGNTYTLSASFTNVTPASATNFSWFALGFAKGLPTDPQANDNRFVAGATAGRAWMIARGVTNGSNPNQFFAGNATSGTTSTNPWSGGLNSGGDIDLQIVLDTESGPGTFTASYFAKRPEEVSYTQVGGPVALLVEDIAAVGVANSSNGVSGALTKFTLETSGNILVAGDVNGDLAIDALDFNIIRDHLYQNTTLRSQGDLTGDGIVNLLDFRQWKSHASGAGLGSLTLVPEPATLWLFAVTAACVAAVRRRGA